MIKNRPITIGEITVSPGERANVNLPIADLYTATSLFMPLKVVCGRNAGPILFVSAALHGDELNGVEVIRRLLRRKILKSLKGTLIAVPVVNVHGFINQSRYLPDRRDLNRSFPGSPKGSIAARLANTFLEQIVSKADFGIDLHTGAVDRTNLPQIRGNMDDAKTLELAQAFGAPVVLNSNILDGSLRASAAGLGMPMLIYEAGEARRFDEVCIRAGIRGVLNVMRAVGMLPEDRKTKSPDSVVAHRTKWIRAPESGIVCDKVKIGSKVLEGQRLATISDPLGTVDVPLKAPFDGIVIGCTNLPLAYEGEALFHIAAFEDVSEVESAVEDFSAKHEPELRDD